MISSFKRGSSFPALVLIGLLSAAAFFVTRSTAEEARAVPTPAVDEQAGGKTSEVAVIAGGCFWGVQGVFQHVAGVTNAVSGYAGGDKSTAHYEMTSRATPATRNRFRSPTIRARSPTGASCRSISRSRMIRPSSIARARTKAPNIARRSFR